MQEFRHLIRSVHNSLAGCLFAARRETAFRQELVLFAILAPLSFWAGNSPLERALLIASLMLVLIVELLNSAIEAAVDRVSRQHHPLSRQAKDLGSAAVFVSILNVIVVWSLVAVFPRL